MFHTNQQRRVEDRNCRRQQGNLSCSVPSAGQCRPTSCAAVAGHRLRCTLCHSLHRASRLLRPSPSRFASPSVGFVRSAASKEVRRCSPTLTWHRRKPLGLSSSFRGWAEVQTAHEPPLLRRSSWPYIQCNASSSRRVPTQCEPIRNVRGYRERYACANFGQATA